MTWLGFREILGYRFYFQVPASNEDPVAVVLYGFQWLCMVLYGNGSGNGYGNGYPAALIMAMAMVMAMVLYGFVWFCMVLYGFLWFSMVFYGFLC